MHLVYYEEAEGERAKAIAACEVVRHKSSKRLAWQWADTAIEHAVNAGANEDILNRTVGDGRWPNEDMLEAEIKKQLPD